MDILDDINDFEDFRKDLQTLTVFKRFQNKILNRPNGAHKCINKCHFQKRFNPLTDFTEVKFRIKYRYSKENIRKIIEIIRDDLEIEHCQKIKQRQVPVDLQIMAAIRLWGGTEHPDITAAAHGISTRTLFKIGKRVAAALSSKASRYIRMPATLSEKEVVVRSFQELANFPQVIGVVGHASIRLKSKFINSCEEIYDCDNNFVHIQVVCDATHRIRDLDLRMSDDMICPSEIFNQSRIKERFEQNEFRGRLLLGNDPLLCSQFLFTPVHCPRNQTEELYNRIHASTYSPAMNCLNLWLRRFGVLKSDIRGTFAAAKQTVTALALLHNMSLEWKDLSLRIDDSGIYSISEFMSSLKFQLELSFGDERARRDFIKTNFSH